MPITRKQFESDPDEIFKDFMKNIYDYLVEHKDAAFTENELAENWKVDEKFIFHDALDTLVDEGAVEIRSVKDQDYYSYGPKPLEN